jgi:hypothetical protein
MVHLILNTFAKIWISLLWEHKKTKNILCRASWGTAHGKLECLPCAMVPRARQRPTNSPLQVAAQLLPAHFPQPLRTVDLIIGRSAFDERILYNPATSSPNPTLPPHLHQRTRPHPPSPVQPAAQPLPPSPFPLQIWRRRRRRPRGGGGGGLEAAVAEA